LTLLDGVYLHVCARVHSVFSTFDSNSNGRLHVLTCFIQTYSLFMSSKDLFKNRGLTDWWNLKIQRLQVISFEKKKWNGSIDETVSGWTGLEGLSLLRLLSYGAITKNRKLCCISRGDNSRSRFLAAQKPIVGRAINFLSSTHVRKGTRFEQATRNSIADVRLLGIDATYNVPRNAMNVMAAVESAGDVWRRCC